MRINDIVTRLTALQIEHEVVLNASLDEALVFKPASLKNMISEGIYFVQEIEHLKLPLPIQSVILTNNIVPSDSHVIKVKNPQLAHYKLMQQYHKPIAIGIHPTAIISDQARIGKEVSIGPYCVIGQCVIGDHVQLKNHVVIEDKVQIAENCFIDSHTVIGADGLAWIWDEDGTRVMQPQLGGVIIEANCILATDITVVRGSLSENTRIGEGTVIAHGTKIGHGSQIGEHVHMANNVSLAGNAMIGDASFLGSGCVISSNIKLPNNTIVGAGAMVNRNFANEFLTLAGVPAIIIKENNFDSKPSGVPKPFKK